MKLSGLDDFLQPLLAPSKICLHNGHPIAHV